MKKTAMLLALLMVVGQAYVFAYPATVNKVLDEKSQSDIHPVQDAAKIAGALNSGVNKAFEIEPLSTVDKVRIETYKAAKTVTNELWDLLTLRSFREKKA